ncbi:hypothetical protein J1N35_005415 [Gossypium stocksii]|uniref:Uncharacterized protein n=1 Tax=Gossypium stocksii TaxID=47602 RepID=A0A9D4AJ89_9ROSI|nr:hypothetical protein J1N35_005415 [Gossypium stocksii]
MEEKEAEIEKVARIERVKIGKDTVVEVERGIGERIGVVIIIMSEIEIMGGIETETGAGTLTEKGRISVLVMWEVVELNWHLKSLDLV